MFRTVLIAAIALLAMSCTPAQPKFDGITAIYTRDGHQAGLVIKAANNGDYRIDQQTRGSIRAGGVEYRFFTTFGNTYSATVADIDAVEAEVHAENERRLKAAVPAVPVREARALKPGLNRLPNGMWVRFTPPPVPRFELVEGGEVTVGGQRGRLWTLRRIGDRKAPPLEVVISTDPALAPIGKLFARNLGEIDAEKAKRPDSFEGRMTELLAKGTVLRFGRVYALERIDRTPLRAEDFARPGTSLDRDGLRKGPEIRIRREGASGNESVIR